jgi:hypothetical protein
LVDLAALTMVVTKWDMVLLADANHAKAVEETLAWLQERFAAARVGEAMAIVEVAARSTIRELPLGHGLNELLGLWSQRPATDPATPTVASLSRIPHSSYDLFRARRFEYYG